MALKAGRVGVAPDQVDEFGKIKSEATSGYTKQEADAKFSTKDELRIAVNDIDLLMASKLTDVYGVMGENGAKNELDVNLPELKTNNTSGTWSDNVYTIGSLTFTFNTDKTITVNGTNGSSNTVFWLKGSGSQKTITFDRKMILSGLPSGSGETSFWYGGNNLGTVYDVHEVAENTPISLAIVIKANVSISSKVFSTMLRDTLDTNPTYQPYAMTNRELTEKIQGIIDAATDAADFAAFKTAIATL